MSSHFGKRVVTTVLSHGVANNLSLWRHRQVLFLPRDGAVWTAGKMMSCCVSPRKRKQIGFKITPNQTTGLENAFVGSSSQNLDLQKKKGFSERRRRRSFNPKPSYSRQESHQEPHLNLHSQSDWLLTFGLSNPGHSLVRKKVINGKERHFLKVFQRYCVCKKGTNRWLDEWTDPRTTWQHSILKHSSGHSVKLFKSFCRWQQRQHNCIKAAVEQSNPDWGFIALAAKMLISNTL